MEKKFVKASNVCCSFEKHENAPYMRRSFHLAFRPENAQLSICGLGFYRLFINGKDITKGAIAPYISNPDHFCYFDTYEIAGHLEAGENVIGILLGNGFMNPFGGAIWDFEKADWKGAPRVALELRAFGEGQEFALEADESFKVHPSPILFDELRMGEHYDANMELPGWNMPGYDDSDWENAVAAGAPRGELKECEAESIRIQRSLKPSSIVECDEGYLYDFGENTAGITELKLAAKPGQRVVLWHGELLKGGKFSYDNIIFDRPGFEYYKEYNQKTIYVAKGKGTETYTPSFTYYGFRYVLVQGIEKEQATDELLTCHVMNSDLKQVGDFSCSDEMANTLFAMVKRSDLANFYYFPTDCPHREKNGWTGDASMSANHMVLLYDVEKSYREWLNNIRKAQDERGALPGIVPTAGWGFHWGNGPAWDSVLFNLPYMLYRYRGCTDVIRENAHAMVRYLEYILTRRSADGTIAIGLGDWVPVGKEASAYDAPLALTDSIMVMDMARKGMEMFRTVGYEIPARFAEQIYQEMRSAIRRNLLDAETMEMAGKCQSSQALALYYGVFEKEEKEKAFTHLLRYIHAKQDTFDCGFLGMHVLFHVLSDFGYGELAYKMITGKHFPCYGYFVATGETTLTEMFLLTEENNASHNHHFLGDIARWFMTRVAGLSVQDDSYIEVRPDYISTLTHASAQYEMKAGMVSVKWKKTEERYVLEVCCPEKVECRLVLPKGYETAVSFVQRSKLWNI